MQSIGVFCGSRTGQQPLYQSTARSLGEALARRGVRLVYGGGKAGLMGVLADAALAAGGEVIGVMPAFLVAREIAHMRLTSMRIVESMPERKAVMAELSEGFITLPGGYGTMDEFFEMLTWSQLDLHHKPQGLLNVAQFYDPLLQLFDRAVGDGFLSPALRALIVEAAEPEQLLDLLADRQPQLVA